MLKELSKRSLAARCQKGAWERWSRKAPHNRVRRPAGGFGVPEPLPEPPLDPYFCPKKGLPSGKEVVVFRGEAIEQADRQARRPKATPEEVEHLPVPEAEVRRLYEEVCRPVR